MDRLTRSDAPECLLANIPTSAPDWDAFARAPCHRETSLALLRDTDSLCSFCSVATNSISACVVHFKPLDGDAAYPEEAFTWTNLFTACASCAESKANRWFTTLLKPDVSDYDPQNHFWVNPTTGELVEKDILDASSEGYGSKNLGEMRRAKVTIKCLNLNRDSLLSARRHALTKIDDEELIEFRFLNRLFPMGTL
jgi:uncharacterized protein (TIGR02646 family)